MAQLIADIPPRPALTEADRLAERNFRANVAALATRGCPIGDAALPDDLTWIFGRDGYLTCFEPGERWYGGCSVPLLAARAMLKSLDGAAPGAACFLAPAHAAQVRVVLERTRCSTGLLCMIPDDHTMIVMLHCDDFSADIARGRLWFAWGERWADELSQLMSRTPGLPTPSRFIRMPDADGGTIERLVADAQRVFTEQNARRSASITSLRAAWTPPTAGGPRRVCVVARSTFRLWDDAGDVLYEALAKDTDSGLTSVRRLDPDDPAGSSPLAFAAAAAACDLLVAADMCRADAPRLAPDGLPWVTWVTTPHMPTFRSAGANDRLLLADPAWRDAAVRAGWPTERIGVAAWPLLPNHAADDGAPHSPSPGNPAEAALALIADTCPLDVPQALAEFSSVGLLWEKIRGDVLRDPFALRGDVAGYLRDAARADGVAQDTLDVALFTDRLIVPAYQHALADALLAAGLPVRLHGSGWADIPRFRPYAGGPITSRAQLRDVAARAAALVHAWPTTGAHPIDGLGRPVHRKTGTRKESFLRDARLALAGRTADAPAPDAAARLSVGLLLSTCADL